MDGPKIPNLTCPAYAGTTFTTSIKDLHGTGRLALLCADCGVLVRLASPLGSPSSVVAPCDPGASEPDRAAPPANWKWLA
jgi:hypothetical protein